MIHYTPFSRFVVIHSASMDQFNDADVVDGEATALICVTVVGTVVFGSIKFISQNLPSVSYLIIYVCVCVFVIMHPIP